MSATCGLCHATAAILRASPSVFGIGEIPVLMDGGYVTSPSVAFFSPKGEWDVENHGVEPDVVVEQDPKAVSEGHDPQLEKAVAVALQELALHPNSEPKRPAHPVYR
jgi:tricorn protease